MHRFSDFAEQSAVLDGEKVRLDDMLDREITVLAYAIKASRYSKNKSGCYLTLQIETEGKRKILFTGSDVLIDQMKKYGENVPFLATLRKVDRFYTLC